MFRLNDFVPNDLTDEQKKNTICEWFQRPTLSFPEYLIRTELNQAPRNIKIEIEKPIEFKGELIDFADIVIEYEIPDEEMSEIDKNINRKLTLNKLMCLNNRWKESILSNVPKTKEMYGKQTIKALFSVDYSAEHLFKDELKLNEKTHQVLMEQCNEATPVSPHNFINPPEYKNLKKECLLISVIPTVEALKADINKAIRRIKTLDFYLKNVTQKYIVYWGMTDDAIKTYLKRVNIGLSGLYEDQYTSYEVMKAGADEFNSLMEPK